MVSAECCITMGHIGLGDWINFRQLLRVYEFVTRHCHHAFWSSNAQLFVVCRITILFHGALQKINNEKRLQKIGYHVAIDSSIDRDC